MLRGVRKRLSGHQQRKAKEAKVKSLKKYAGSILQYVDNPNDGQCSSKDET